MSEPQFTIDLTKRLKLKADGRWFYDDDPITHPKLSAFFHRSIQFNNSDNSYVLRVGPQEAKIEIEDTAYFVTSLDLDSTPAKVQLLDGSSQTLEIRSLTMGKDDRVYITVNGAHRALLLRGPYQELIQRIDEAGSVTINGITVSLSPKN